MYLILLCESDELIPVNPEKIQVDEKHHIPHRGAGGEEAAVEPEVEPNDVETNRQCEECTHYLTPSPKGEDSEEVYDHHHIEDVGRSVENLNKGEGFVGIVEVAGGWWEDASGAKDRHEENKTKEDLGDDV